MRPLVVVVVLLVIVFAGTALAADPPGGPTWYLLQDDQVLTVTFEGGTLTVAGGTPGQLLGVVAGQFRIQFERGIATSRNGEITTASGVAEAAALIFLVDPKQVRAMLRQSSKTPTAPTTPSRGGAEPGALGALGSPITGAGVGGSRAIDVARDTTVVVDDRVNVVQRSTPTIIPAPAGRPPGPEVLTPPAAGAPGGSGKPTRVIGLDEHEALLAKLLGWLGEEGARCETKGYGPGWISICTPRSAA
jgi:hypothetical protein